MIEILDSNEKDYKIIRNLWIGGIFAYNTIVPIWLFVISPILGEPCTGMCITVFIIFMGTADPLFIYLFWETKKEFSTIKYVKISLSDIKFEIYIQNHLYFQQYKDELKIIEIVKIKSSYDYDLNFIGITRKTIRIALIIRHEKKTKQVLEALKMWCKTGNIPIKFQTLKRLDNKEYENDKKEISEFLKRKDTNLN